MALVTIPGNGFTHPWVPYADLALAGNANFLMDGAGEQVACVFAAPSGVIRKIGFRLTTVTSAPTNNHDIRLETVDATTGLPSGTLVGTNTNAAILLNTTGWKEVTLTADASPTEGTPIAIVIKAPATNFGSVRPGTLPSSVLQNFPYSVTSAAAKTTLSLACGVIRDDGTVPNIGTWPVTVLLANSWDSGNSPDRRGMRFRLPGPARLRGLHVWLRAQGLFDVVFYGSDGTTATVVADDVDSDIMFNSSTGGVILRFTSPQTLLANTWYRLVLLPTTSGNLDIMEVQVNSAAWMDGFPGGSDFIWTSVNGAPANEAAWTNTGTSRMYCGLIFDQISDGIASAGEFAAVF